MKQNKILLLLLFTSALFLSGCWQSLSFLCDMAGDSSNHCYQWMAVQSEDPAECQKIPVSSQFEGMGSNPPKDKCYLLIAEKTGDPSACDDIEGGLMSYTIQECYESTAQKHTDAEICLDSPNELQCRSYYARSKALDNGFYDCGLEYEWKDSGCTDLKGCRFVDDCGSGQDCYNGKCVTPRDETCAKDSHYAMCTTSKTLEECRYGRLITVSCPDGCDEAQCVGGKEASLSKTSIDKINEAKSDSDTNDVKDSTETSKVSSTTESDKSTQTNKDSTIDTKDENKDSQPSADTQTADEQTEDKTNDDQKTEESADKKTVEKTKEEKAADEVEKLLIDDYQKGKIDKETKLEIERVQKELIAKGILFDKDKYQAIKEYYQYVNDPNNNIDAMTHEEIMKTSFGEKVGNVANYFKFWKANPTAEEKNADIQLRYYSKMLEKQKQINDGTNNLLGDVMRKVGFGIETGGKVVGDIAVDKGIEYIFTKSTSTSTSITTAVLGEAINTVKEEAQAKEFRDAVRAYNRIVSENVASGQSLEQAHRDAVSTLSDPLEVAVGHGGTVGGTGSGGYVNLLQQECNGNNPHCLNKDIFFRAMKKSYKQINNIN